MIGRRPLLQPDPYDPYRLSQQKLGVEECRGYVDQATDQWVHYNSEADRFHAMWQLGAWLEPAIEGLSRQYPEAVNLCDVVDGHTIISGLAAYERWMRLTPAVKPSTYLDFTPLSPHPVSHSLLLGWPTSRAITLRTSEADADHSNGIFTLHNSYYEAINEDSYLAFRNSCIDVLPHTNVYDTAAYSPFMSSTRAERRVLGSLVRERFGDFTADVYDEHDTAGLGEYRLWSTLNVLFDRLVDVS
jgi:hypothetical protein